MASETIKMIVADWKNLMRFRLDVIKQQMRDFILEQFYSTNMVWFMFVWEQRTYMLENAVGLTRVQNKWSTTFQQGNLQQAKADSFWQLLSWESSLVLCRYPFILWLFTHKKTEKQRQRHLSPSSIVMLLKSSYCIENNDIVVHVKIVLLTNNEKQACPCDDAMPRFSI